MTRPMAFFFRDMTHLLRSIFLAMLFAVMAVLAPSVALAASCGPATTGGTAPADYKAYCWLDFSGYSDATAQLAGGQNFTFPLPDGSTISMNLQTTLTAGSGSLAMVAKKAPSYSGAAFGNTAFLGIPGQPILYTAINGSTVNLSFTNITVTAPSGGSVPSSYSIIFGDGESTNGGESLSFTTNGAAWQQVATIANGSSTTYPTVTGVGTTTVTETGVGGTVGSFVFASASNPTTVSSVLKASGLQGIIVGVRYASITSVSQISGQRYNTPDQFNYAVQTQGGTTLATGATSGTALNGFTPAAVPTVAASYPFVVSETMAAGSTGTLANYTSTLTCVNNGPSSATNATLPTNVVTTSYAIPMLRYGDAVACTFTNTPIYAPLTGTIYNDANHNNSQDGSETGTGLALYVKLATSSGGVCQSPAIAVATAETGTGAWSFANLAPGSYCLVLSTGNATTPVTPVLPAGWVGLQNGSGLIQLAVTTSPGNTPQNFGLYNGSKLSGTVFADTGVGSGTANNGVKDGSEAGLGNQTVNATVSGSSTPVSTASTSGDGSYTLWLPASTTGAVTVAPATASATLATGGSAGTTGGKYTRPNVVYAPVAGQAYTGVNFGEVPVNTFSPNGAQAGQPGTTVTYAHTLVAGSGGSLVLSTSASATPANSGWAETLYRDLNCNAQLDSSDLPVTAPIAVTAGQNVCVIVKEFIPAGAPQGANNTVTVTAVFTYTNASPALSATLTATDLTTVGQAAALALTKQVSNVTQAGTAGTAANAKPGDTLQYSLTAINNGTQPLTSLVLDDATPAFTAFVSAACPTPLPTGLTACSVTPQPVAGAQGGVQWNFTGSLTPGAQVIVTYQVKVNQ